MSGDKPMVLSRCCSANQLSRCKAAHTSTSPRAPGMVDREALSDRGTHRVASDDGWAEVESVHECGQVLCEILRTITCGGTICVAVTPLGKGESANGIGKVRQHALEGAPRIGDAVQQQHGRATGGPLFNVGEPDPTAKLDGIDSE